MKRMSIAEQTLQKEIRNLDMGLEHLVRESDAITHKMDTLRSIKRNMEAEQHRLCQIRERASVTRMPKG